MSAEHTTAETIEAKAAELGIGMRAEFVPWHLSRNATENGPSLNWKVTITHAGRDILTTDYSAGIGHCPGYKQGVRSIAQDAVIRFECENGKPAQWRDGQNRATLLNNTAILPRPADVYSSMFTVDSEAIDYGTFEEWADTYGYDHDSRKAEATYRACVEMGLKLRAALGDEKMSEMREACHGY